MCPIKRSDHVIRPKHLTSLSIAKFNANCKFHTKVLREPSSSPELNVG